MTSKTEIVHFTNAPEIKHFATVKSSPNDNVYGIEWGNIVRKYLEDGYKFPTAKNDIECDGKRYRVLDRGGITAFYDFWKIFFHGHQSCQNTPENKKTVVSGLLKVKVHGLERLRPFFYFH